MFGLEVKVYMVRASYDQKPYRRILMETYGAQVVASPSPETNYGRRRPGGDAGLAGLAGHGDLRGGRGRRDARRHEVLARLRAQPRAAAPDGRSGWRRSSRWRWPARSPDVVIGCAGGGSNFAGLTFPFVGRKLRGEASYRVIAAEPEAAPSLTRGVYAYDFGDTGHMAPLVKMHTLGSDFIPEPIHAGGLRYHGMAPLVSLLKEHGVIEAPERPPAGLRSRPACSSRGPRASCRRPRATHAIKVAIDEALAAKEAGESRVILFNLSGHGHFDLAAYESYLPGPARGLRVPGREGRGGARRPPEGRLITDEGRAPRGVRLP